MKTVAIFDGEKPVTIQRFEADKQVGERKVYMRDFIESLTTELPFDNLVALLCERKDEIEDYVDGLSYFKDFSKMLSLFIENVPYMVLKNDESVLKIGLHALEHLDEINLTQSDNVWNLIDRVMRELPNINPSEEMGKLTLNLLNHLLSSNNIQASASRRAIAKLVVQTLSKEDNDHESLKSALENLLPHIEDGWLIKTLDRLVNNTANSTVAQMAIPKNCVFMNVGTKYQTYVLEVPKSQIRVKYFDAAYENVGHPRLLTILKIQDNKLKSMSLVAIKEGEQISASMKVYHYPYSNVYGNGLVCWSGYKEPGMINNLELIPHLFLSTTNNSHLKGNVRELFEEFQNKPFPDEILLEMEGETLQSFLS